MSAAAVKRWSVTAVADGDSPVRYFCEDRPIAQSVTATLDGVSPVQLLLLSVAGCFALSCRAVLVRRGLGLALIDVEVTGEKSTGPVSKLARLIVTPRFAPSLEDVAVDIAKDAKAVCTVTQTLAASAQIVYAAPVVRRD